MHYFSYYIPELTHSTGHPSRIGREGIEKLNTFGSESYSKEELVAEMGAAMLAGIAGIGLPCSPASQRGRLGSFLRRTTY
jgi:antirestriction protein ArdC